ncbi:mas-related G-protein coupled receptor member H-like [Elgaria multicarinata webbii]|uniref:mas-related G-protein coupled receptor member H-like n=1 Tax=Elgaria multicarinata webbii TaxID=159646 RepID=UPI002FCCC5BC
MAMNVSLTVMDDEPNDHNDTGTDLSYESPAEMLHYDLEYIIAVAFTLATCCTGLVGNGIVIRLLGFHIKRNPYTTYILTLAVFDFGFLTSLAIYYIFFSTFIPSLYINDDNLHFIFLRFSWCTYISSELLLTAISIDRCVSILFPIWHRCHRPTNLSITVCVLISVFSFLISVIPLTPMTTINYPFFISALLCLPLMTISTVIILIKVCFKSQQRQRGKLLMAVLLCLLFFLILGFPLTVIIVLDTSFRLWLSGTEKYFLFCASLNSSVNPVIYLLVGRKKGGRSRETMKAILQRVLKEGEEDGGQELDPPS